MSGAWGRLKAEKMPEMEKKSLTWLGKEEVVGRVWQSEGDGKFKDQEERNTETCDTAHS